MSICFIICSAVPNIRSAFFTIFTPPLLCAIYDVICGASVVMCSTFFIIYRHNVIICRDLFIIPPLFCYIGSVLSLYRVVTHYTVYKRYYLVYILLYLPSFLCYIETLLWPTHHAKHMSWIQAPCSLTAPMWFLFAGKSKKGVCNYGWHPWAIGA